MKEAIITDVNGLFTDVTLVSDEVSGVEQIFSTPEPLEDGTIPEPVLIGYRVAVSVPEGLFKPKFDVTTGLWGEGLPQTEIDNLRNTPVPKTPEQVQIETINDRTVGMQAIDDFTLQSQTTIDQRTQGMQAVDDFALQQITDLQQQVADLLARVTTLEGGTPA